MLVEAINHNETTVVMPYGFRETPVASQRINRRVGDIIGADKKLDFSKPFLPESLARTESMCFLTPDERLVLNQIKGHAYLAIFGLVEEFIFPFALDCVRRSPDADDYRARAFLQFAGEKAEHIQLFEDFAAEFRRNFAVKCPVIGSPSAVARKVLAHQPLAVALAVLHVEWMTQRHFIGGVTDNRKLDAQFKSLLKYHWLEEARHAKLNTLLIESLADGMTAAEIERAVDEYLEIVALLDEGLWQQTNFDMEAFERAVGYNLSEDERADFLVIQYQANRWTYLGSGMTHPKFLATVEKLNPAQRKRLEEVAPIFC